MITQVAKCPTCGNNNEFCNGEETIFCETCGDTIFTQHYEVPSDMSLASLFGSCDLMELNFG